MGPLRVTGIRESAQNEQLATTSAHASLKQGTVKISRARLTLPSILNEMNLNLMEKN